jgi:hypothetical protein
VLGIKKQKEKGTEGHKINDNKLMRKEIKCKEKNASPKSQSPRPSYNSGNGSAG